jgi:hypothetical protein
LPVVIPAKAGIHFAFQLRTQIKMDSRLRGNDGLLESLCWLIVLTLAGFAFFVSFVVIVSFRM